MSRPQHLVRHRPAPSASAGRRRGWLRVAFLALAAFTLTPWASPPLALALGGAFALVLGNPVPEESARASRWLLQASVVGLGFGMELSAVADAGASGIGYTVLGVGTALGLGSLLGRWLRVEGKTSFLITAGTSICGGSAIAAVGPVIGAPAAAMSVALATVFVLNAVALYLFPPIGHLLGLTQEQFAVWAAVAIHDTSSVVGAASVYGPRSLEYATVLKLARALWIVPLVLGAALRHRARSAGADEAGGARVRIPGFIGLFLLAALLRTASPAGATAALDGVAHAARTGLVLTLFLIGAGLRRDLLRTAGLRPLVQGFLLWVTIAGLALFAVERGVGAGPVEATTCGSSERHQVCMNQSALPNGNGSGGSGEPRGAPEGSLRSHGSGGCTAWSGSVDVYVEVYGNGPAPWRDSRWHERCSPLRTGRHPSDQRVALKPIHAGKRTMVDKLRLSEEEWEKRLSPEEYRVLRQHGTEPPREGCFLGTKEPGTYVCAACGNPLFKSGEKFESGTGWPSFTRPVTENAVTEREDLNYGMVRTEVRCARCDSHLGHVFPDGPPPTGLRYCINSVAMKHVPEGEPIRLVTK